MNIDDHLTTENIWEGNNNPWGVFSMNYILRISIKGQLKKFLEQETLDIPFIECSINFNYIESKISHEQYQDILDTISDFMWYQGQWQHYVAKTEISPFR